jgi:hypothetical protein
MEVLVVVVINQLIHLLVWLMEITQIFPVE